MRKSNLLGLGIIALGFLIVSGYGAYQFAKGFLFDQDVPLAIRFGLTAVIIGLFVLLISLIMERVRDRRKDN